VPIDFDAAEQQAKEEEQRKAKLLEEERIAKDKAMEEELKRAEEARKAAEEDKSEGVPSPTRTLSSKVTSAPNGKNASPKPDMERLGMGMRKLAFGSVASDTTASSGNSKKYP
jgi:ADP-ribosylation factor GTPase-activating protein 2/3